jgi:eukaryotic-like serine/threonine-protein kinase
LQQEKNKEEQLLIDIKIEQQKEQDKLSFLQDQVQHFDIDEEIEKAKRKQIADLNVAEKTLRASPSKGNLLRIFWIGIAIVCLIASLLLSIPLYLYGVSIGEAHANVTATAGKVASATAVVLSANPYPSYFPGKGTLAYYDPLSGANSSWDVRSNADFGGNCQFTTSAYHVTQSATPGLFPCALSNHDFTNLALEVQMKIIKGDCGGMVFRDIGGDKYYMFRVCQDGTYALALYGSNSMFLAFASNSDIKKGLNQTNLIAVVATGDTITLYTNQKKIDEMHNSTYSHGKLGFVADAYSHPTEVAYTNVKVWTLQ